MKAELATVHHRISQRKYSHLDLEDKEFVELELRRSRIGLILLWTFTGIVILGLVIAIIFLFQKESFELNQTDFNKTIRITLLIAIFALAPLVVLFSSILTYIYQRNVMYITNRRVIQLVKSSPFAESKNIIELASIEDASYIQKGILQYLFKYGTLRLATVGDETTYTFKFLDTPTDEVDKISHLVHQEKERQK